MPILIAVICLTLAVRNDNQASMPIPMSLTFTGEYSYDGDNWYPYKQEGTELPASSNMRVLRPTTNLIVLSIGRQLAQSV